MGVGLGSRRLGLLVPVALLATLAACGRSVADVDKPIPTAAPAVTLSPFCAAAKDNADALRPLNGFAQRGTVPSDQLQPTVDAVRHSGIELLAAAPPDIRSDVQIVAVDRDPAASATAADSGAVAASQRVSVYITRTCTGGS
jgi:hypothetical protein